MVHFMSWCGSGLCETPLCNQNMEHKDAARSGICFPGREALAEVLAEQACREDCFANRSTHGK